jgi:N-acetylmuramic acid 6-phosphate etherase
METSKNNPHMNYPKQSPRQKAEDFLAVATQFQLGDLPTEQRHPDTYELADLCRRDIKTALRVLKEIDVGVARKVAAKGEELTKLEHAISETLRAGHKVFFYGCGATGRLSMSIEYIWRYMHKGCKEANQVLGFMSGGDLALVHSIENFEDHPEFGARQVREIGFGPHDLLVSTTEGGETPSVIGATEEAARISSRKPFFLYCNPTEVLHEQVERSRRVIENPGIEKICLFVGNMALSGSTRLQASTALQLAAGGCLLRAAADLHEGGVAVPKYADFIALLNDTDFSFLEAFAEEESRVYQEGEFLLYETDEYGITILTDTTERAPTFSLLGFENQKNPKREPSLSYLRFAQAQTPLEAWRSILLRDPITIEWEELRSVAGRERLMGFDFSSNALEQRQKLTAPKRQHIFRIERHGHEMRFELDRHRHSLNLRGVHPLFEHLLLKFILNIHSLLVMGRLGRFESNVMTWVKPSNKKLIDRSIRYVEYLLHHQGVMGFSYEDICRELFEQAERMTPKDAVVLMTVEALKKRAPGQA